MDLCHCAQPAPKPTNGSLACTKCGLWYDEAEWRRDPRVARAQAEITDQVDRICGVASLGKSIDTGRMLIDCFRKSS